MSCRRVCRELLWLARFGELGRDSEPHLEHLSTCRACRDEVGFDRVMVEQLRAALSERVASVAPSPGAWDAILARARDPEPRLGGWRAWSSSIVGRLRLTALAASGLALILALNTQIVPMAVPTTTDGNSFTEAIRLGGSELRAASSRPASRPALVAVATVTDAVGAFTSMTPMPPVAPDTQDDGLGSEEPAPDPVRVVFLPADTYPTDWADGADEPQEKEEATDPMPAASEPGEPS